MEKKKFTVNDYRTIIGWLYENPLLIFICMKILIQLKGLSYSSSRLRRLKEASFPDSSFLIIHVRIVYFFSLSYHIATIRSNGDIISTLEINSGNTKLHGEQKNIIEGWN